ncbi:MAG: hypothetical protein PHG61_04380 [Candidatus Marinimicrobia bacterium]|jgi:hypothetical protein|nr:hypothetical protein [Candidatus Neomarinimicrobiota bacterium]
MLSDWELRNITRDLGNMVYSAEACIVRLEWFGDTTDLGDTYLQRTGGSADTLTTGHDDLYGTTPQTISGKGWYLYTEKNIPAYIHILNKFDLEKIDNAQIVEGDVVISMATDKYLSGLPKLRIVHCFNTNKVTGTGTGSGAMWTMATAAWTKNQYVNYWLVFDDRRFRIISNTAITLTVDLAHFALPDSGSFTIQSLIEYYPKFEEPSLAAGMDLPLGNDLPLQTLICSRQALTGIH